MAVLKNRVGVATSTTGTGATITLGAALTSAITPNAANWQTFAGGGVANGDSVRYLILDSNGAWEYGPGTYTAAGTSLSRATGLMDGSVPGQKSSSGSLISLTGTAHVFITAVAEDIPPNLAASKLLGRGSASGTGPGEEITLGTGLSMSAATLNVSAGGFLAIQKPTTSFNPTAGMKYCVVELVGGGGGSGGVADSTGGVLTGGGGGSGGYSRITLTAAQIAAAVTAGGGSISVTLGAAGTAGVAGGGSAGGNGGITSFGALCTANGGGGGAGGNGGVAALGGAGGTAASLGDIVAAGSPGGGGMNLSGLSTSFFSGGHGGSSFFGGGGRGAATVASASVAGNAGTNYGSGAGGAHGANFTTTRAGAAGAAGFCIVTEYS